MREASIRNAFGTYLVRPAELTREERLGLVIGAVPGLRFGSLSDYVSRWLADSLEAWLRDGGDLEVHLGVRPPRGSRRTAPAAYATLTRDRLLLRLSVAVGSDVEAMRVLQGERDCPKRARAVLNELSSLKAPGSTAAFTRARRRISRDGR